ncbi:MAG: VOC family protein [Nitrospiraceae bacterium]
MKVMEIAFTSYPVTDLKRARQFYEGVLGLEQSRFFGKENTGFVEYDIGSGTLAIGNVAPDWKPSAGGGSVGLEVDDFDAAITRLRANGCAFRLEPMETPVCHMAVISDPDGNSVTIHQRKVGHES